MKNNTPVRRRGPFVREVRDVHIITLWTTVLLWSFLLSLMAIVNL